MLNCGIILIANTSPKDKFELFNLRHSSARNVIEQIFGVLKCHFRILAYLPKINMDLQACLPAALAAIHNFICDLDPIDLNDFQEVEDAQLGWKSGDLAEGLTQNAERQRVNSRHNHIAEEMWQQYQRHLAIGCPLLHLSNLGQMGMAHPHKLVRDPCPL